MNVLAQHIMQPDAIEIFGHQGKGYAFYKSALIPEEEFPQDLIDRLMFYVESSDDILLAVDMLKLTDSREVINRVSCCRFGELNSKPDFHSYSTRPFDIEFTVVHCPLTDCPVRGLLCCNVTAFGNKLSVRETEIVTLLAGNLEIWQIAERLAISVNTINTHLSNIMPKLGVYNARGVVAWAIKNLNL